MSQTVDRRALIRRSVVVGAAAWTAPVVVESVLSPAGAITGLEPGGCYKVHVRADTTCLTNWDNSDVSCGADCCDPTINSSDVCPAGYYSTTLLDDFGINVTTSANNATYTSPITQCCGNPSVSSPCNIGAAVYVKFTSTRGCVFTAATAHLGSVTTLVPAWSASPALPNATVVVFNKQGDTGKWNEFHLCLRCP
jgi:hypothetical protein